MYAKTQVLKTARCVLLLVTVIFTYFRSTLRRMLLKLKHNTILQREKNPKMNVSIMNVSSNSFKVCITQPLPMNSLFCLTIYFHEPKIHEIGFEVFHVDFPFIS